MEPLASVGELRRITGAAWSDGLAALEALRAASAAVRAYCGWAITTEDHAEVVLDSRGGRVLGIPCLRVTAVHEVELLGPVTSPLTADRDYTWSAVGLLYRHEGWRPGFRAVRVVYSGGYDAPPEELRSVVAGLAGRLSLPAGVAGMTVGSQTVTFTGDSGPGLSTVEEAILDRYRIAEEP